MAQAVTVYRWDDPGAPQIVDGRPSEFINVFKKCLVEGYGDKQPLGWQVQLEEAINKISFINDVTAGGSGGSKLGGIRGRSFARTSRLSC